MQPIIKYKPMAMMGLDYVGPIMPTCLITGAKYILLGINYFTQFIWAKAYTNHQTNKTVDFMYTCVSPLFGWPQSLYTDNGTHFTGLAITAIYQMHGVLHYKALITHPSLVGLIKKNVQLLVSTIRNISVSKGNTYG